MKLINNVTGVEAAERMPKVVARAIAIAESLPDGHYLTTRQMSTKLGVCAGAVTNQIYCESLAPYRVPSPEHSRGHALCNKKTAKQVRESHDRT